MIENRLHDLNKDLDRLLTMDESEIGDLRIKQISNEMLQLRQMKKHAELDAKQDMGRENKAREIMELISAEDLDLTEYSTWVSVKCCSQKECKGFLKNEKLSGRSQHG